MDSGRPSRSVPMFQLIGIGGVLIPGLSVGEVPIDARRLAGEQQAAHGGARGDVYIGRVLGGQRIQHADGHVDGTVATQGRRTRIAQAVAVGLPGGRVPPAHAERSAQTVGGVERREQTAGVQIRGRGGDASVVDGAEDIRSKQITGLIDARRYVVRLVGPEDAKNGVRDARLILMGPVAFGGYVETVRCMPEKLAADHLLILTAVGRGTLVARGLGKIGLP